MHSHKLTFLRSCIISKLRLDYSKPFLHQSQFFGMLFPDARRWAHSRLSQIFPTQQMGMTGQQCPTPTGPQQRPTNHQQIPSLQMNTSGIPVYQLDAFEIQALLTQTTMTAVGATQGSAQDSNKYEVSIEFKVL